MKNNECIDNKIHTSSSYEEFDEIYLSMESVEINIIWRKSIFPTTLNKIPNIYELTNYHKFDTSKKDITFKHT